MITQTQLDKLKALTNEATPGPWTTQKYEYPEFDIVRQQDWTPCGSPGHQDCSVCQTVHAQSGPEVAYLISVHASERAKRNAEFIAAARTAMPLLIAEVERLARLVCYWQDLAERLSENDA